jgi:uridine phosphorylase
MLRPSWKDFPRTADLRVYHLGLRPGEVANRIVSTSILGAFYFQTFKHFNEGHSRFSFSGPNYCRFLGRKSQTLPFCSLFAQNMSQAENFPRLGSCGCLIDAPVGTIVVPKACVAIVRNVDFDYANPANSDEPAYRISKPVCLTSFSWSRNIFRPVW